MLPRGESMSVLEQRQRAGQGRPVPLQRAEYLESIFAAFKVGFAAVNTNYRYTADELVYLWDNADVVAVVFHGAFVDQCEEVRPTCPGSPVAVGRRRHRTVPRLGDTVRGCGRDGHRRPGRGPWGRSGDHLLLLYTGGTTGHAEGCDVAAGRPVRRARREQRAADAARTGPRRRAWPDHQGRSAQHAGGAADARHRAVQRASAT